MSSTETDDQRAGSEPTVATRVQVLATEHWSLLATRSLLYTESFSRVNMFFAVLSGAVIALALIAQAGRFGDTVLAAAILILLIVVFVGIATITRVGALNGQDVRLVAGMNRLRRAYLELHPELEPYFVTSSHDDIRGIMLSMGEAGMPGHRLLDDIGHGFQTLPGMLSVVVSVVGGALIALVALALGAAQLVTLAAGAIGFLLTAALIAIQSRRAIVGLARGLKPSFPSGE